MKIINITILLIAVISIAICGCTTPTTAPTATPVPVTPTPVPTITPSIMPTTTPDNDRLNNSHAFYGRVMWESHFPSSLTRPGMWAGEPITDAIGEVHIITKLSDTPIIGYIRSNYEFRVDDVPTGNDVKIVMVVIYMEKGAMSISAQSYWMPFNDVWARTPADITI